MLDPRQFGGHRGVVGTAYHWSTDGCRGRTGRHTGWGQGTRSENAPWSKTTSSEQGLRRKGGSEQEHQDAHRAGSQRERVGEGAHDGLAPAHRSTPAGSSCPTRPPGSAAAARRSGAPLQSELVNAKHSKWISSCSNVHHGSTDKKIPWARRTRTSGRRRWIDGAMHGCRPRAGSPRGDPGHEERQSGRSTGADPDGQAGCIILVTS